MLDILRFYPLFDFEVSLIFSILRWSLFAGVDHGCWSCIFKFRIQATVASTTGEKCFVCYTEYNTHGISENIEICVFLVHKAKTMENTLRHEGQNTCAVPMKSMILWNFVSWCLGDYFLWLGLHSWAWVRRSPERQLPNNSRTWDWGWSAQGARRGSKKVRCPVSL